MSGDLVEREAAGDAAPCLTLGLVWRVCPVESEPVGLRLADAQGRLLEIPEEAEARGRAAAERARAEEAEARATAEARPRARSGAGKAFVSSRERGPRLTRMS